MAWHEQLGIHDLVENSEIPLSNETENQIQWEIRDLLLSNEATARITYDLSANESKDNFTIRLGNISGNHTEINFDGTHESVRAINNYILLKLNQPEIPAFLEDYAFPWYTSTDIALLQEDINRSIEKIQ